MAISLPGPMSFERFKEFRADPTQWLPAATDLARSHSLPCEDIHVFPNGSNLVVALNSKLILKIFPPMLRYQFVSERLSLLALQGALRVLIPEIVVEGERDGWAYLVITRLKGVIGDEAWPSLPEDQKERVLWQVGALIAEVQKVLPGDLLKLDPQWKQFLPKQIEGCRDRHRRLGLPPRYLDGIDEYLCDATSLIPTEISPVILTGEYIPENFLLEQSAEGWTLSGLIDFGDVMTGWREYDLLGPSTFMAGGKPGRIRKLLHGFGYSDAEITPALTRRLMTLFLLHRYSDLARQVRIEGWQEKAKTLPELERLLWPVHLDLG